MSEPSTAERLAAAARAAKDATAVRDELIGAMADEGHGLRPIAAAADMSPSGVRWVLARLATSAKP